MLPLIIASDVMNLDQSVRDISRPHRRNQRVILKNVLNWEVFFL